MSNATPKRGGRILTIPEGLRVDPDGVWTVGGQNVVHAETLKHFKSLLRFDETGAYIAQGHARVSVQIDGPPFSVLSLRIDAAAGEIRVQLDDDSEEELGPEGFNMDAQSGRFECRVRHGRARAVLGRGAHQTLLFHAEESGGKFHVSAGSKTFSISV